MCNIKEFWFLSYVAKGQCENAILMIFRGCIVEWLRVLCLKSNMQYVKYCNRLGWLLCEYSQVTNLTESLCPNQKNEDKNSC